MVMVYVPAGKFEKEDDVVTPVNVVAPIVTVYGLLPPKGETVIDPFEVHVVLTTVITALTPALI